MGEESRLLRVGRRAWAVVGVLAVVLAVLYAVDQVRIVAVAFVLACFPAALMSPLAARLRATRLPDVVVGLLLVLLLLLVFVVPGWLVLPVFVARVPDLLTSVDQGLQQLSNTVEWSALPGADGFDDLRQRATEAFGAADVLDQGLAAATALLNTAAGLVILLVVLFFCLKDGRRLWQGLLDLVPAHRRDEIDEMAQQSWWTLGAYLRGQLLVALFDAVFIGLGLWLLGVPLAFPLAVLVFFGGLFPIVGAFVSGLVAVLVALADQGLGTALLVLLLILVVQQVEGNVFQPLVMTKIIALHPLVIILSVTGGGLVLGVLGAFLAVPVAAITARLVDHLRGRTPAAGPGSEADEPSAG